MAIEISQSSGVAPVVSEIPQNNAGKKKEVSSTGGQTVSDEVNISGDASFISSLKSSIDSAQSASTEKLASIKQKVVSGNYADSSKIAEGIINNLNITGE